MINDGTLKYDLEVTFWGEVAQDLTEIEHKDGLKVFLEKVQVKEFNGLKKLSFNNGVSSATFLDEKINKVIKVIK